MQNAELDKVPVIEAEPQEGGIKPEYEVDEVELKKKQTIEALEESVLGILDVADSVPGDTDGAKVIELEGKLYLVVQNTQQLDSGYVYFYVCSRPQYSGDWQDYAKTSAHSLVYQRYQSPVTNQEVFKVVRWVIDSGSDNPQKAVKPYRDNKDYHFSTVGIAELTDIVGEFNELVAYVRGQGAN